MALVDLKENVVVIRIVYDGPPFAGKTTTVRTLARSLVRKVETPLQAEGRTLYFDWLEYTGGLFEGRQIRCQIVSVPGQRELLVRRRALLATADVVVFVADSGDPAAVERSVTAISELTEILRELPTSDAPVGVIVQANKRDLPTAVSRAQLRAALGEDHARTALTESVAELGTGIRETFVLAVRVALDRVRAAAGALRPGEAIGERELLAALEALPIDSRQAPYIQTPAPTVSDAPRLPDVRVPTGAIWPPVEGRMILHEATAEGLVAHRTNNGDWAAGVDHTWRIHSAAAAAYHDFDEGRRALLACAREHANHAEHLSRSRCVVLAEAQPGVWRLWQILKSVPSLRTWLTEAMHLDLAPLYGHLVVAAAALGEAHTRWPGTRLSASLDTVGIRGAGFMQYVALMPHTDGSVTPALTGDKPEPLVAALVEAELRELFQEAALAERCLDLGRAAVALRKGGTRWDDVVMAALAAAYRPKASGQQGGG